LNENRNEEKQKIKSNRGKLRRNELVENKSKRIAGGGENPRVCAEGGDGGIVFGPKYGPLFT
jgi:hypothetical protein